MFGKFQNAFCSFCSSLPSPEHKEAPLELFSPSGVKVQYHFTAVVCSLLSPIVWTGSIALVRERDLGKARFHQDRRRNLKWEVAASGMLHRELKSSSAPNKRCSFSIHYKSNPNERGESRSVNAKQLTPEEKGIICAYVESK